MEVFFLAILYIFQKDDIAEEGLLHYPLTAAEHRRGSDDSEADDSVSKWMCIYYCMRILTSFL